MKSGLLKFGFACAALSVAVMATSASAAVTYMRSTTGAPWGQTTNEAAMDAAFGAGNWSDLRYETVNSATLFSAANTFIFMEGGDRNADELEAFLGANGAAISAWVNAGGSLFVNAAPNEGDGMSYGFGVSLNYPDFRCAVHAANAAHPIFSGLGTTNFTGSCFEHATVSGAGLTGLILQDDDNGMVLAEMGVGSGHLLVGGMTTTNFHGPQPAAFSLRVNILEYAASQACLRGNCGNDVPEPGTLLLMGAGVLALAARRRKAAVVTEAA